MVSEYKATQNPIHHELTPGENEVSKPPQLDFETSVVGKFKGPITTTKVAPPPSMGGLLSTWKRMLWLIHHLNQKNWCSTFEGTKTDENLSHGVDDDKKSSQKHGELCKPGDIARSIQQSLV
ncbi:hypothetical protein I503_00387 [Candida albicans SC5314]|nr:hypothetical protein W5Q_03473 [Candida albicans SC5314]KHC89793.1 hypothetical protein I503_00387 [Candida albicans SC5314]